MLDRIDKVRLTIGMNAPSAGLVGFADGVWLCSEPVKIVGMPMRSTMTVLRLGSGKLLLHSPVRMTDERRAAVEALGPVAHLYAPNPFHHRWIGDWAAAFPSARVHAPEGLAKRRRDLRIDRIHGESPEPAFSGLIDELPIEGFRLRETALLYRRRARWWSRISFTTWAAQATAGRPCIRGSWVSTTRSP